MRRHWMASDAHSKSATASADVTELLRLGLAADGFDPLTRRSVIQSLLAAGAMQLLPACTPNESAPAAGAGAIGESSLPQGLAGLRRAIRASADFLPARADDAVRMADPAAIIDFVARTVGTLGPTTRGADAETEMRWGARAALRGGLGTPRERAELVAELLRRAGFTATVKAVDGKAAPSRVEPPPFDADLNRFWKEVGLEAPRIADRDPVADLAAAEQRRLMGLAPALLASATREQGWTGRVPVVEFTQGAATRWVDLGRGAIVDTAPAGLGAASAPDMPVVNVALEAAFKPVRGSDVDGAVVHRLAEARWSADQVAGRRLLAVFPPRGDPELWAGAPLDSAAVRRPLLRLVGEALPVDITSAVAGTIIHLGGGPIAVGPVGSAADTGPLGPIEVPAASRASDVSALAMTVDASAFPEIQLTVRPTSSAGAVVTGLLAADLRVGDAGVAVRPALLANTAPRVVRALVIVDSSGSLDDVFQGAGRKRAFFSSVADALVDAARSAPFVTQVIGIGDAAARTRWAAPDHEALAAAMSALGPATSDVWGTLGRSLPASGASLAILISDNEASDLPEDVPGLEAALAASGIPVAVLPVGRFDRGATERILAASRGVQIEPNAADTAARLSRFVQETVGAVGADVLRLTYRAPTGGPAERRVELTVGAASAAASYTVPKLPVAAPGLVGVYLTISIGDQRQRIRLGGVPVSDRDEPGRADAAASADARAAVDGVWAVSFDVATPTTAALLDDAAAAAEGALAVKEARDAGATLAETARRILPLPFVLPSLADPVRPSVGNADPRGLLVRVSGTMVRNGELVNVVDIPPALNGWVPTATPDGALAATIGMMAREFEATTWNAFGDLRDAGLAFVPYATSLDRVLPAERAAALAPLLSPWWQYHRLVTLTGPLAAWLIDPATGSAFALDAEGRGGGGSPFIACLLGDTPVGVLVAVLSFYLALVSTNCAIADLAPSVPAKYACIGADIAGAGAAAWASFSAPAPVRTAQLNALLYGAGLAAGDIFKGPGGIAGRAVVAVLSLLISNIVSAAYCAK